MLPANAYVIRHATDADEPALRWLSEIDSRSPLAGPALIAEIDGSPAAAISLADGRVVADPFRPTGLAAAILHARAESLHAVARTPSLAERLRAAVRPRPIAHATRA